MKFAVIGGTGLVGSRVVENLNAAGHQAVPHSLDTAGMFAAVHGDVLTARNDARIAPTPYTDWLS